MVAMKNSFFALALLISLSACGGDVKETLGLKRNAPDEFAVERRPRLDVPPEFKIRPPSADGSSLRESSIRDELREDIIASDDSVPVGTAESLLLSKIDAENADANIRRTLADEYGDDTPGFFERIESLRDDSKSQTLVDAEKERERITANKKEGKPITEGEVETRSSTENFTILEKIMGE